MRLAGQERMGYYPTPLSQVALIASWLSVEPGKPVRLFDPCAGQGEALAALAQALARRGARVETWGVELSPGRAEQAALRLDRVLPTAWEQAHVRDSSISLLFENPPYDHEGLGDSRRQEWTFLKTSTPSLMPGGVLVYIVPEYVLRRHRDILRHLSGWYRDVRVFQFTPEEYEAFRQVVLIGVKREAYHHPKDAEVAALAGAPSPPLQRALGPQTLCLSPLVLWPRDKGHRTSAQGLRAQGRLLTTDPASVLGPSTGGAGSEADGMSGAEGVVYTVPEAPKVPTNAFYYTPATGDDYARAIAWEGISVPNLVRGEMRKQDFRPVMPLKKGHLAMLLSAGLAGQMALAAEDGTPLLVRGRVIKDVRYTSKAQMDVGDGHPGDEVVVVQQDVLRTVIAVASPTGVRKIADTAELRDFVKAHARQMADLILARHRPLYNFDALPAEWQAMAHLSRYRYLPGRAETGLMKAQKHVTVALARLLREHGAAILNGQMGWGKTTVAAALPVVLRTLGDDVYPVLVACPAHLVENWAKEIREIVPLAQVRIISPAVHGNAEDARRARKGLVSGGLDCSLLQFIEDCQQGLLGERPFAVISYETLKLGPGYDPVAVRRSVNGETVLACPDCGQPILIPDEEDQDNEDAGHRVGNKAKAMRPVTWGDLQAEPRFCQAQVARQRWDPERERLTWREEPCGAPLHTWTHFRRQAGADLLRRFPGLFGLFVGDEAHKAKGGDTDVGAAFGKAVQFCRYSVALTGTLFGGKSKSLFYVLYRLIPEVRQAYGYGDEDRWSEDFGVRKQALVMKRKDVERGFYNGYRRKRGKVTESPGISPAVLRYLLPYTVFATLSDLGYELPPYREEAVVLDMDPEQRAQYERVDGSLRTQVREKPRLLATWLQTTLGRPDTAFREEEIVARITVGHSGRSREVEERCLGVLPPVVSPGLWRVGDDGVVALDPERDDATLPSLLPKERWLADFCRAEVTAGRRVLVYVRLTGERDIQDRLREVLSEAGLGVAVLRQNVGPRRRMRWVRKHLTDVLITNPRLVETGVNLVDYATAVFYQIDWSLYTTWQALARLWRPGQVLPVRVVFVAYRDSLGEHAVGIVGEKMAAGKTLYGDEVSGAIVPEPEDDFLDELARAALQGRRINLEAIFARENEAIPGAPEPSAKLQALKVVRRPSLAKVRPVDPMVYRQEALF